MPQRDWAPWMRALGVSIRHARELTGLTQRELATVAGISQGALSRLEAARGLSTPLLVVVRVVSALRRPLTALPIHYVPEDVRWLLALSATGAQGATSDLEAGLRSLLTLYCAMDPLERAEFVRVAEAVGNALVSTPRRVAGER